MREKAGRRGAASGMCATQASRVALQVERPSSRLLAMVAMLATVAITACDDSVTPIPYVPVRSDAGQFDCIDLDGDGYGAYCEAGPDCDDTDESLWTGCLDCSEPRAGCECESGTDAIACVPPPYRAVDEDGVLGTYHCADGTRFCADGVWGECQALAGYVFIPD